jgi:glycosyltransferase involved in cell wall biosynthesis
MKVLLFSPVSRRSSIARVSGLVALAMRAQGHDVSVVQSEETPDSGLRARGLDGVPVISWKDRQGVLDAAERVDGVVYQIGDHFGFHRGAVEWLPVLPGTVCLHDFYLADLFNAWAQRDRPRAERILATWYGAPARDFFRLASEPDFVAKTAQLAPMTEWISSMAVAVVTHSSWGIDRVLRSCPGPVRVLALPYEPQVADARPRRTRAVGDEFNVLTYGWIVANKRVESVIESIAADPMLRERTTYRIVGPIEPAERDRLEAKAAGLGVRAIITGEVTDEELASALSQADVVCCLRWPTLEAASASTIEALLCAKAVVVVNAGFYAELPDTVVYKISPEREIAELQDRLRAIEAAPDDAAELGDAAAAWARETFQAHRYAVSLLDVVHEATVAGQMLGAAKFAVETLVGWGGADHTVLSEPTIAPLAQIAGAASRW